MKILGEETEAVLIDMCPYKSLTRFQLFATPWMVACQAPRSMGFSRQECWSGLPFPSPEDLPNPGIELRSPALQADTLVAQTVKRLPAMQKTWVSPWVGKVFWRRKWQSTPVLLPGKSHGWRSVVGYRPWGRKELDMTERLHLVTWSIQGRQRTKLMPRLREIFLFEVLIFRGNSPYLALITRRGKNPLENYVLM